MAIFFINPFLFQDSDVAQPGNENPDSGFIYGTICSATLSTPAPEQPRPVYHGPADYKTGPRGYVFRPKPTYYLAYIFNFPPTGVSVLDLSEIEMITRCATDFIEKVNTSRQTCSRTSLTPFNLIL